jgi:hypothetical protein
VETVSRKRSDYFVAARGLKCNLFPVASDQPSKPMSTTTEIRPLKSKDAHSCMLPTEHVKAMVKAMKSADIFTVEEDWDDAQTVRAYHTASRREVYAAIHKGNGHWIIRHHRELFTA